MVRRVTWSKNAFSDKLQILDYWYKRIGSKTYSRKLDKEFRKSIKNLNRHPFLGKKLQDSEVRYIVREYYLIFYKIYPEEIRILHIWDSRRCPEDLVIEG